MPTKFGNCSDTGLASMHRRAGSPASVHGSRLKPTGLIARKAFLPAARWRKNICL